MKRIRLLAAATVVGVVALIASYYLFGGPLHLSLYFPVTPSIEPKHGQIPIELSMSPLPPSLPLPKPTPTPSQRPHPSMRVPTHTDALLHASPRPISLAPTQAPVTPPPAPSYEPVTPPPYGQTMPPVIVPYVGVPLPGTQSPSPGSSP